MRSHSLLHAPVRPPPCARTAFSKPKSIICDNVSGNKDSPICRQDGREPQTERQRNQAATLPSACCFRARFEHAARCRATSGHIMRCRATFGRSDASERPNLARERSRCPKTARESRGVQMSPEPPAASGCRPNLQRRPDVARQMQRNYHSAIDTQESATMSTSRDARPPHVRVHASTFRIIS